MNYAGLLRCPWAFSVVGSHAAFEARFTTCPGVVLQMG
jgi:hypothetical protein